jgi:ATP-dependent Clp protease ATP-binding subunit ClpB
MFLLALCDDKGECGRLARQHGLVRKSLEQAIASVRGGQGVDSQEAEGQRESLKPNTASTSPSAPARASSTR